LNFRHSPTKSKKRQKP